MSPYSAGALRLTIAPIESAWGNALGGVAINVAILARTGRSFMLSRSEARVCAVENPQESEHFSGNAGKVDSPLHRPKTTYPVGQVNKHVPQPLSITSLDYRSGDEH